MSLEEKKLMISSKFWSPKSVEEHIEETLGRVIN